MAEQEYDEVMSLDEYQAKYGNVLDGYDEVMTAEEYQAKYGESPSIGKEALAITSQGVGSLLDLADLASLANIPQGTKRLSQLILDKALGTNLAEPGIRETAERLGFEEVEPETSIGKILGGVAKYAPTAMGGGAGALKSALTGGAASGLADALGGGETAQAVAGLGGAVAPQAASALSRLFASQAKNLENAALGVSKSALRSAEKYAPTSAEEPVLSRALEGAKARGLLKGDKSPEAIILKNEAEIETLGNKVSEILKSASQKEGAIPIVRSLENTEAFIKSSPFDKARLEEQLTKRLESLYSSWDGTLEGLNKLKQGLYKIGYAGTSDIKGLDRALASDLKISIEKEASRILGDNSGGVIRELNRQQGENLAIRDLLENLKLEASSPQGAAKALKKAVVAPIGGGAAGVLASLATGNPVPAVLGALGGLASTKTGQFLTADALKLGGKVLSPFAANSSAGALGALFQIKEASKEKKESVKPTNSKEIEKIKEPDVDSKKIAEALQSAVIQQESGGDPFAVSKEAGAKGLMQLMDATGKEWHQKLGIKEEYNPFDPNQNKKIGTAYLTYLLDLFNGDPGLALTAYHSGEGKVKKLLQKTGGSSLEDILEYEGPGALGPIGRKYALSILSKIGSNILEA